MVVECVFGVGCGVVADEYVGGVEVDGDGAAALGAAELVVEEGVEVGVCFVEAGDVVGGDGGAGEVHELEVGCCCAGVVEGE